MERCKMNRNCGCPGNVSSGSCMESRNKSYYSCDKVEDTDIYELVDRLPLTMAYVPDQRFKTTFELQRGFHVGTIFPELCKPFCGKRGVCR